MADVSHELGSLRYVVDSPLSSKVAMFNNQAQQHKQAQLLNPFSQADGRASPKPTFSKDEYGKPLAGSLTEMRGQKASMHVLKEMVELCQIISSEGYDVKDEPHMRVIPFGELFNIYNYISDKVVGILLRARKHKLVQFEGEMLFQRRDDDVPVFLLQPIAQIRKDLESKIDEIKRGASAAPLATTLLLDKGAHTQKLQESGLSVPNSRSGSKSRTASPVPTPNASKAASPATSKAASPAPSKAASPARVVLPTSTPASSAVDLKTVSIVLETPTTTTTPTLSTAPVETVTPVPSAVAIPAQSVETVQIDDVTPLSSNTEMVISENASNNSINEISNSSNNNNSKNDEKTDINNNESENTVAPTTELTNNTTTNTGTTELPVIVIEASATHISQQSSSSTTSSSAEESAKQSNSETQKETTKQTEEEPTA